MPTPHDQQPQGRYFCPHCAREFPTQLATEIHLHGTERPDGSYVPGTCPGGDESVADNLFLAYVADGARSLNEVASLLEETARDLRRKHAAGWLLLGSVNDGTANLVLPYAPLRAVPEVHGA